MAQFESGALDAVEWCLRSQERGVDAATTLRVLPITPPRSGGSAAKRIFEAAAAAILEQLLPLTSAISCIARSWKPRRIPRRAADGDENATDNAGDIIELLQRTYNRARQARSRRSWRRSVGGAEALKG